MPNHLISEKSPYLIQHSLNPVDWHPWGSPAFEKARREDKPIFLSVGYSTCHWCHVMEHESFEDPGVAAVLNQHFVSIKMDREERPDVDRIYMTYVQAATGSGGWPMSVWLTPELRPFYGGTYFPPDNRYGRPGFKAVLESLANTWATERDRVNQSSLDAVAQLASMSHFAPSRAATLDRSVLDSAYYYFRRTYDATDGGFGDAPKFPRPSVLNFLLRYWSRYRTDEALEMTRHTLSAMAGGGMHDQLGGGFHRYSVDARWFVPHFEKMLYDQAQLAISYLEAFQITGDASFAQVARSTLDYVRRDMTSPEGAFFSAEDADSAIDDAHPNVKAEGAFYIWTRQEIDRILGNPDASIFSYRFGVTAEGNVTHDPHEEFTGKNILFIRRSIAETASHFRISEDAVLANLNKSVQKLMAERAERVRPHLDDKILTAWNGLMISAFAKAAQILDEPSYVESASRAAEFLLTRMRSDTLLRRYRDGEAAIPGFLDDYAFLIQGLLDLYEADFNPARLETAMSLAAEMRRLFEDGENGGFFTTSNTGETLILRVKDDYDGAEPAGNSMAALALLRLAQLANQPELGESAERAIGAFGSRLSQQGMAAPQMLVALDYYLGPNRQIVIAGDPRASQTQALVRAARSRFLPRSVVLLADFDGARSQLSRYLPELKDMTEIGGQPAAYVCENYTCRLPTADVEKFIELLQ